MWIDAVVVATPAPMDGQTGKDGDGGKHRLRADVDGGSEFNMVLSPFNHAPRELPLSLYNSLWKRHCRSCRSQVHAHVHQRDAV